MPVIESRCRSGLFHLILRFLAGEEDHRLREVTYRERLYRHLPIGLSHTRKATPGGIFRRGIARCRIMVVMPVPGAVPPAAISREQSFLPPSGIGRTIPGAACSANASPVPGTVIYVYPPAPETVWCTGFLSPKDASIFWNYTAYCISMVRLSRDGAMLSRSSICHFSLS